MKDNELDKQWLKDIRQSMDNYTEELPDDGWKAILSETEAKACPQVNSHRVFRLSNTAVRWSVAAVWIMVFGLWCSMPVRLDRSEIERLAHNSDFDCSISEMHVPLDEPSGSAEKSVKQNELLPLGRKMSNHQLLAKAEIKSKEAWRGENDIYADNIESNIDNNTEKYTDTNVENSADIIMDSNTDNCIEEALGDETRPEKAEQTPQTNDDDILERNIASKNEREVRRAALYDGWSLGMHAGGVGLAGGESFGNYYGSIEGPWESSKEEDKEEDKDVVVSSDDHISFCFGKSYGRRLTEKVSVESGLVYTRLTSTVEMSLTGSKQQTLNYIGLPIGLRYDMLEYDRWSFYGAGNVTMEKCIGARRGEDKIHVGGLQWSMSAALGCQYNLFGHMTIYFEPGLKWYVNDHADVPSIRTEHPCSFNMMMGIRLNY
ncbi:MAG: hypothetical protein MJZ18_02020 [Bacteroidales bacterium]|nr:hypothetical protein [Bacteroidales bacterium]